MELYKKLIEKETAILQKDQEKAMTALSQLRERSESSAPEGAIKQAQNEVEKTSALLNEKQLLLNKLSYLFYGWQGTEQALQKAENTLNLNKGKNLSTSDEIQQAENVLQQRVNELLEAKQQYLKDYSSFARKEEAQKLQSAKNRLRDIMQDQKERSGTFKIKDMPEETREQWNRAKQQYQSARIALKEIGNPDLLKERAACHLSPEENRKVLIVSGVGPDGKQDDKYEWSKNTRPGDSFVTFRSVNADASSVFRVDSESLWNRRLVDTNSSKAPSLLHLLLETPEDIRSMTLRHNDLWIDVAGEYESDSIVVKDWGNLSGILVGPTNNPYFLKQPRIENVVAAMKKGKPVERYWSQGIPIAWQQQASESYRDAAIRVKNTMAEIDIQNNRLPQEYRRLNVPDAWQQQALRLDRDIEIFEENGTIVAISGPVTTEKNGLAAGGTRVDTPADDNSGSASLAEVIAATLARPEGTYSNHTDVGVTSVILPTISILQSLARQ